jgi:ribosomal protein L11 methylase PrmA
MAYKKPMRHTWFAITLIPNSPDDLSGDELDTLCAELIDRGAKGTAVDTHPEIICYLEGDKDCVDNFIASLDTLPRNVAPLTVVSINTVADDNWTGACPEVWDTVTAGSLVIAPVESLNDPRPTPNNAIKIIPGLGFGTGHHATTKMVLEELSELAIRLKQGTLQAISTSFPERIFDLGTGSGILAIAAAKLFKAPVDANEIDPAALDNARLRSTLG